MAIPFFEEKSKRKYFLWIIFGIIILIAIIYFARNYLVKPLPPPPSPPKEKKVEINYEILENPAFEGLQPFEEIPPFEEEIGRENPFLPY